MILVLIFQILIFSFIKAFLRLRLILSMSLNFIIARKNDKWYNKRVLIWRFTLVLIKINYGQIGDQKGSFIQQTLYFRQSVRWKPMFFRTKLIFTGFVRRTSMFGNLWLFTQARRSSHLRYFRSPRPILLARTVGLVAKFEDCRWPWHVEKHWKRHD